MEPFTLENGLRTVIDTVMESKSGKMVLSMKVNGVMKWLTVKEELFTEMALPMKVNG
jgi:hypothetical protein